MTQLDPKIYDLSKSCVRNEIKNQPVAVLYSAEEGEFELFKSLQGDKTYNLYLKRADWAKILRSSEENEGKTAPAPDCLMHLYAIEVSG